MISFFTIGFAGAPICCESGYASSPFGSNVRISLSFEKRFPSSGWIPPLNVRSPMIFFLSFPPKQNLLITLYSRIIFILRYFTRMKHKNPVIQTTKSYNSVFSEECYLFNIIKRTTLYASIVPYLIHYIKYKR